MKTIALFGGSFNPPHDAHFKIASHIYQALGVDEVWMLYSINWQKDPDKYASLHHRVEMGKLMLKHFNDAAIVLSDIEEDLGTHITYEVLTKLKERFPDINFVWCMGADSLVTFYTWEHSRDIMEQFPVIVLDRPTYDAKALEAGRALADLEKETPQKAIESGNGWSFLHIPAMDMSSSHLLEEMRQGRRKFDGPFQDVADYIVKNRLYGIATAPSYEAAPKLAM